MRRNRAANAHPAAPTLPGYRRWAACVVATVISAGAHAFTLEGEAPIRIQADTARLDDQAGTATYSGRVIVRQGESLLEAEKVVLYRGADGLDRIEASGTPAHFRQVEVNARGESVPTQAWAQEIHYSSRDNMITLKRSARIEQDGNLFKGEIIQYHVETRVVTAEGAATPDTTGTGRVEMVIQPRKLPEQNGARPKQGN